MDTTYTLADIKAAFAAGYYETVSDALYDQDHNVNDCLLISASVNKPMNDFLSELDSSK